MQQTKGGFARFILGKGLSEFLLVNGLELVDGLAAELLWCVHVTHFTAMGAAKKNGAIAGGDKGILLSPASTFFTPAFCDLIEGITTGLECPVLFLEVCRLWQRFLPLVTLPIGILWSPELHSEFFYFNPHGSTSKLFASKSKTPGALSRGGRLFAGNSKRSQSVPLRTVRS